MSLGTMIRTKRVAMNITIQELADAMQVTRVTIVHVENDKSPKVRASLVARISKYLRLDPREVMDAALLLEPV